MKNNINLIFKELFYILSGALAVFSILEIIFPNLVLAYVNINWVLILWFIIGIIILIINNKNNDKRGNN